jgi:protein YIPF5/7
MDDSDLAGPLIFFLMFGTFLLLSGKIHFGYIYGVALIGTLAQYVILNLMALKSIDFTRTASVIGYCMLPLVATSGLGVILSLDNALGYLFSSFIIIWCTYSSSAIFVSYLQLSEMRVLVAYPLALFYGIFSVMTLFAERAL